MFTRRPMVTVACIIATDRYQEAHGTTFQEFKLVNNF